MIEKILSGEKTIESRWYKTKRDPWDRVKTGDTIYFKNSSEPIIAKANVSRVQQYILSGHHFERAKRTEKSSGRSERIQHALALQIYENFGKQIGLSQKEFEKAILDKKDKNYCILIWLENPQKVKPFNIDKTGYGVSAAWITLNNINQITV